MEFEPAEQQWATGLGMVRDVVRQELVARQLRGHLPPRDATDRPVRVLDLGCGQGTQAIRLAADGYHVTGVDQSAELLARAREEAAATTAQLGVADRLDWVHEDLFAFARHRCAQQWDVVCCHGVAMYQPSLSPLVGVLASAVDHGGLVSLLTRNQAGIAMRAGMTGQWRQVAASIESDYYTNRIGVVHARADRPGQVHTELANAGLDVVAWYGVRLFSDHWDRDIAVPEDVDALVDAEEVAGRSDPYRAVCALTHTIARRR